MAFRQLVLFRLARALATLVRAIPLRLLERLAPRQLAEVPTVRAFDLDYFVEAGFFGLVWHFFRCGSASTSVLGRRHGWRFCGIGI
jgi:hypothetical protein